VDVAGSASASINRADLKIEERTNIEGYLHSIIQTECPGLAKLEEQCHSTFAIISNVNQLNRDPFKRPYQIQETDMLFVTDLQVISLLKLSEINSEVYNTLKAESDYIVNYWPSSDIVSTRETSKGRVNTYYLKEVNTIILSIKSTVINEGIFGDLPLIDSDSERVMIVVPVRE